MALYYLFNSTIKNDDSTNILLRHLLLEAIGKKFGKKKFYLMILTDFRFETLPMLNIMIRAKLDGMIY